MNRPGSKYFKGRCIRGEHVLPPDLPAGRGVSDRDTRLLVDLAKEHTWPEHKFCENELFRRSAVFAVNAPL